MKKLGVAGAILALALLSFLAPSARAASGDAVSLCINVVSTASGSAVESCVPVSAGAPLPVAPSGAGGGNVSASLNKGPISITPPVTASAYTANNAIGGLQTGWLSALVCGTNPLLLWYSRMASPRWPRLW